MRIFILHYSKLTERKQHILDQLQKYNILDYEFVERYDKETLIESDLLKIDKCLPLSVVSLLFKHFYAWREIKEKYNEGLVLEDDVIFCDDFINILNKYLMQIPRDYDMVFLGDGDGSWHIPQNDLIPYKLIYEKDVYPTSWGGAGVMRGTDAILVSKKCAEQMCRFIDAETSIYLPVDWFINKAALLNKFKVYWAEPTIISTGSVTKGSVTKIFNSSIDFVHVTRYP